MGKITCYCNANGARLAIGRFVPPFSCFFKGFCMSCRARRLTTRRPYMQSTHYVRRRRRRSHQRPSQRRPQHQCPRRPSSPGDIAVGVVIGRASEYFDFFVYAIASVLVFPAVFFPFADRLEGTLYSFAIFALALSRGRSAPGVHVHPAPLQPRNQADHRPVPAGHRHRRHLGPAHLFALGRVGHHRAGVSCASARASRWAGPGTACRRCWR
jgi:hypothetical protein